MKIFANLSDQLSAPRVNGFNIFGEAFAAYEILQF